MPPFLENTRDMWKCSLKKKWNGFPQVESGITICLLQKMLPNQSTRRYLTSQRKAGRQLKNGYKICWTKISSSTWVQNTGMQHLPCQRKTTLRIVQDYWAVNKVTEKDTTPLPSIQDAVESLGDKVLFSKYDICKGYNNIQIVPKDWWKAAFKMHMGLFEPNIILFGL